MSSNRLKERNVPVVTATRECDPEGLSYKDDYGTVVENYFSRGKTPKQKDYRRRRNRGTKSDEEENAGGSSSLEHVACDLEKLRDWFEVADSFLPESIKERNDELKNEFNTWFRYLSVGFNILAYGVGSKKILLDLFCDFIQEYNYIQVDAYCSAVTVRTIMQKMESVFSLKLSAADRSLTAMAKAVVKELEKNKEDIILVINNIDGPGLREASQQIALTELAQCRFIHILASCDHLNAPCLWSREMLAAFNFLWVRASTMCCYKSEILAGESKLLKLDSGGSAYNHTASSLEVIWQALTVNSRMILATIVKIYFRGSKPVELLTLYEQARDDFLVTNENVLRQHLVEFLDHRLISKTVDLSGSENISVLVDKEVIIPFLQEKGISIETDDE